MAKTDIEVGCTVLDRENNAYRVLALNEPQRVKTEVGVIEILSAEVTDGFQTTTKLLGELDRAEMMPAGKVLARGYK